MATESELIEALKAADKAGNADDARFLANALQDMRSQAKPAAPQEPAAEEAEPASKMGFLNKGMAEVLGAPVDLIAGGLSKVTGGRVPKDSFGGSESIRRGMENIGATTPDREPETMGETIFSVGGEVAGFAVPGAALARRFRGAQGVGGNLARSMDDALVNAPVTTTAIEAGGAAGAGAGRQLAQENELGPAGQLTAEVVGGLGGSAAGARTLAGMGGDTGRKVLRQIFPDPEREASMRIQSLIPEDRIQQAARMIDDLKGTNLLPSSRTQEPGLMALERTVLERDPAFASEVAQRSSETMEALVNSIRRSGKVQSARKFIEAKRDRLNTALDARIEKASQQAAKALEDVGEDATTAELGAVVRQRLDEAMADAKVQEQMLWQAVPQDTKIPTKTLKSRFKELGDSLSQAQKNDMPPEARELIENFDSNTPLFEADGLYKKLGETARIARKDGQRNQARIAEELRSAILEDIGQAKGSPEVMEALQTARGFSRQMMERFRKGPVGKLLETDATGAPKVPDELTLDRTAGLPGNRGKLAVESLTQAVDDPQALEAVQGYLKRRFSEAAVSNGRVNTAQAESFLRKNAPLLDNFPVLREQLRSARHAEDVARRVEKGSEALRKKFQDKSVSDAAKFLGAPVDQEVGRIFSSSNPERTMGEIAKMARKDRSGKALEGLKAGVTDHILDKVTLRGLDAFGRNPVSGQALIRMLDDPKQAAVLNKVFDKQELRRMRKSGEMLAAIEKSTGSKGTLNNIIEPGMGATLSIPMRVIGAKLGAKLGGGGGAGVNLQAAQIGSSRMNRIWNSLTVGKSERIAAEAVKDPEVMKHLLLDFSKATPQQIAANERFFRNWGLSRPLGLFDDEEDE